MRFEIVKCHGSGNDFPLIDARGIALDDAQWPVIARALADRRGAVGGDGLLVLQENHGLLRFRMWNSDGSEAETCLNGVRCVARLAFERMGIDRATLHLMRSTVEVAREPDLAPGVYTVGEVAGPAGLDVGEWPLHGAGHEIVARPIARLDPVLAFTAVAMPNPHLVAFVDAIDEAALVRIGTICEAAPEWLPNRANVSFVRVLGPEAIFVRTFERGVGLTDSCGSAMAASAFAAALTGRTEFAREVTVRNKGGLVMARAEGDGMVALRGNATWEWAGAVSVDLSTGIAGDLTVARHFNDEIAAWAAVAEASAAA
ncbi:MULTISPECIES: diaminopimelate epimerase [unclassified Sphingomonas]|uniref:diaminopimelate epimerase n=1 Tax=unclassified Sphingomonas TaxID=196159 RepID=UPI00092876DA|nr:MULTISPECIES: diaminopimelate epimerase [unclassified Sphingomonas]MBN8849454.1 diaminopimelate epimerase [Sphingomonas sp.]OJV34508.1 MAG: diaminopimelate epimerase [Sphingomonas sp. 67-36]